ncbi:energy-coupling factor transporter transmembrane protein EcfT [Rossellomorea vietnamensis]|uniref:Energy-coupling factor transporter transmembrane protein EcfT n=2 Tax=Rossellomorea TaxID=2837508 RepID=A0A5D4K7U3_9BACI|nr:MULTISPECIES: energy-coupling factor transporter transmembrane component T [Rossellomorea]TYR73096.1 energy-coupling factor transporter transmembrane protein EcfT [Rossellomorea vietnamensis]TYS73288.1 energy-coupling factor transporter transmembrane protein EcfT [Rossellomorea aquimaris]
MMDKMIFGRYIPSDSFVHRMDPRSKLIFIFAFICIVFLANNAVTYAVLGAFTLSAMLSVKVPLKFLLGGLKPVMWLVLFTFLLHIFFTQEGEVLADFGFIKIYEEGLRQAIFISLRFTYLIIVTTLLTLTTSPISITDGLETLLNPLKKIRFPVHEMALMMSISLRFIPTLMEETDKIIKAQTARGAELATGPVKERIKSIVPLLIPLFVGAFKRAEDLATAMEARGYKGGEGRTKYRVLKWTGTDTAVLGSLVVLAAVLLVLRG